MRGFLLAGTHSGSGKTTVTLGLMAALVRRGLKVAPFKSGPDFIDSALHGLAVEGAVSRNLDIWMCGELWVKKTFYTHSLNAGISVVEGVMGLYDGSPSGADLARLLGIPVVLVIDAFGMAESAAAIVKGFTEYSDDIRFAGVIFNRAGSEKHVRRLRDAISPLGVEVLGALVRDRDFEIPHRHLGLKTADESPLGPDNIDRLARAVEASVNIDRLVELSETDAGWKETHTGDKLPLSADRVKVGVARDRAFCFYYQDNLDILKEAGAEIVMFSPLNDRTLPEGVKALYLGGGYPELYARVLSKNTSMLKEIKSFALSGGAIYAECGGFMYLTRGIYLADETYYPMAGVFEFDTRMCGRLVRLGYREARFSRETILGPVGTVARGHEFHYSQAEKTACADVTSPFYVTGREGEPVDVSGCAAHSVLASYVHLHFGSNPQVACNLLKYAKDRT